MMNVAGSVARHAEEQRRQRPRGGERAGEARDDPDDRQRCAFAHEQPRRRLSASPPSRGARRSPASAASPRRRAGRDADGGEHHRHRREGREQQHREATLGNRAADDVGHRANVGERQLAIDRGEIGTGSRHEGERIAGRPDGDRQISDRVLRVRQVDLRRAQACRGRRISRRRSRRRSSSGRCAPRARAARRDESPGRSGPAPARTGEAACSLMITTSGLVASSCALNISSGAQRDLHRLEVIRRDDPHPGARCVGRVGLTGAAKTRADVEVGSRAAGP